MDSVGVGAMVLLIFSLGACCSQILKSIEYRRVVTDSGDLKTVATVSYWVPFFVHLHSLMVNPERLLKISRYVSHAFEVSR